MPRPCPFEATAFATQTVKITRVKEKICGMSWTPIMTSLATGYDSDVLALFAIFLLHKLDCTHTAVHLLVSCASQPLICWSAGLLSLSCLHLIFFFRVTGSWMSGTLVNQNDLAKYSSRECRGSYSSLSHCTWNHLFHGCLIMLE